MLDEITDFSRIDFSPWIEISAIPNELNEPVLTFENRPIYNPNLGPLMAIDQDFVNDYNFDFYGNYPKKGSNEVVLTKYAYTLFQYRGYKNSSTDIEQINSYDDLIGKEITLDISMLNRSYQLKMKVCGIVDTGFDCQRYEDIFARRNDSVSEQLRNEFNYLTSESLENYLFVDNEFMESFIIDSRTASDTSYYSSADSYITFLGNEYDRVPYVFDKNNPFYMDEIKRYKDYEFVAITDDGQPIESKQGLKGNEAILPMGDYLTPLVSRRIYDFASENIDEVYDEFVVRDNPYLAENSMSQCAYEYSQYIQKNTNTYDNPADDNIYQPGYTCKYFIDQVLEEQTAIIREAMNNDECYPMIKDYEGDVLYNEPIHLAAVIFLYPFTDNYLANVYPRLYVSSELYDDMFAKYEGVQVPKLYSKVAFVPYNKSLRNETKKNLNFLKSAYIID